MPAQPDPTISRRGHRFATRLRFSSAHHEEAVSPRPAPVASLSGTPPMKGRRIGAQLALTWEHTGTPPWQTEYSLLGRLVDQLADSDEQVRILADGSPMPVLGLGVWQVPNDHQTENAVRWALDAGYRHIDTAQMYGNEEAVGRALRQSGVPRDQVFITTKVVPRRRDPVAALAQSLQRLELDYVDLYLIHWPVGDPTAPWPAMEDAREKGLVRSIGVSNYGVSELDAVLSIARQPPVVNQVEFSPFEYRRRLLDECSRHDIVLEAYSPLGTGRHLRDRALRRLAQRIGRSPAQVLLRWCVQRGAIVIPKSTHRERIEENAQIFDFELSDEDLGDLDALDHTGGTGQA
jgi:diketogulonate reductase-like aldo/keto reductase